MMLCDPRLARAMQVRVLLDAMVLAAEGQDELGTALAAPAAQAAGRFSVSGWHAHVAMDDELAAAAAAAAAAGAPHAVGHQAGAQQSQRKVAVEESMDQERESSASPPTLVSRCGAVGGVRVSCTCCQQQTACQLSTISHM